MLVFLEDSSGLYRRKQPMSIRHIILQMSFKRINNKSSQQLASEHVFNGGDTESATQV